MEFLGVSGRLIGVITNLIVLGLLVGSVSLVASRWTDYPIQLDPINVPDEMQEKGLNEIVVTRRFRSVLGKQNTTAVDVLQSNETDDVGESFDVVIDTTLVGAHYTLSREITLTRDLSDVLPTLDEELEIPGADLSVGAVVRFLRRSLGRDDLIIQGEITEVTQRGESNDCSSSDDIVETCYKLTLRSADRRFISVTTKPYPFDEINLMLNDGARRLSPFVWPQRAVLQAIGAKEYDRADELRQNLQRQGMTEFAFFAKALLLKAQDNLDEAISQLDYAILANPRYEDAFLLKGDLLFKLRRFDEALNTYEIVAKRFGNQTGSQNRIGLILLEMGEIDHAIEQFEQISQSDPYYLWSYLNWGIAYEKKQLPQRAVEKYQEVIETAQRNAQQVATRNRNHTKLIALAYHNWGVVLSYEEDKLEEALEKLVSSYVYDSYNPSTLNNWAYVLFLDQQLDEAMQRVDEALAVDPRYALANETKGEILEVLGDYDQALMFFENAVRYGGEDMKFSKAKIELLEQKR